MILFEQVEDCEEEDDTIKSGSLSAEDANSLTKSKGTNSSSRPPEERFFEFSHDMWRSNVLKTMLKERKIELHRQIAQAMEFDKGLMIRRNDISRLLTLYDHWKLCGEFRKAAPLALTVTGTVYVPTPCRRLTTSSERSKPSTSGG